MAEEVSNLRQSSMVAAWVAGSGVRRVVLSVWDAPRGSGKKKRASAEEGSLSQQFAPSFRQEAGAAGGGTWT